jgi:hypothetical protein
MQRTGGALGNIRIEPTKTMKKLTTVFTLLAVSSMLALAEDAAAPKAGDQKGGRRGGGNPEEFFKKLDTNSDGNISLDEFKASPRGQKDSAQAEEHFKKLDANGDGKVTLEELKAGHGPGGRGGKPKDGAAK